MTKKIQLIIVSAIILVIVILTVIMLPRFFPKEEFFDGYIFSGSEFIIFSQDIVINDGRVSFPQDPEWIEANDQISKLFYDNAYKLKDYDNYGVNLVLKIKFEGRYYKGGNYGHLGKYNSMIKIEKVLDYSNQIPGLNM